MGTTLPQLMTPRERQAARKRLGLDNFVVFVIGRLITIKGVDVAIEALAGQRDITLVVAGDGPQRAQLENLAAQKGVATRFLGSISPEERDEWFGVADVVVTPSRQLQSGRTEGLPLVVVEALASAKAVIASDVGGIAEVIKDNENGMLVRSGDVDELRQALGELKGNGALAERLGTTGRASIEMREWKRLSPTYEKILRI
jgi:glycosyltransferase involved in cell wall biosynthesis